MRIAKKSRILGVTVHSKPFSAYLSMIESAIQTESRALIGYVNVHAINMAQADPHFMRFLNQEATSTFCDGIGVRVGARICGIELPHRFTMPDEIDTLCAWAAREGKSLYLIGGREGITARAATNLQARHAGLRIAGTHHGYFDQTPDSAESRAVIEAINAAQPDILLVGFGMPRQEFWTANHWDALDVPVALMVGALFDYIVGDIYRAPRWVTDNGLEWLARLVVEPRRLWKRYVIGNPLFIWRILTTPHHPMSVQPDSVTID